MVNKSAIWERFIKKDNGRAECRLCSYELSSKLIVNLYRHLKTKHASTGLSKLLHNNESDNDLSDISDDQSEQTEAVAEVNLSAFPNKDRSDYLTVSEEINLPDVTSTEQLQEPSTYERTKTVNSGSQSPRQSPRAEEDCGDAIESLYHEPYVEHEVAPENQAASEETNLSGKTRSNVHGKGMVKAHRVKALNHQLIKMIVNGYQSLHLIDRPEFKKFVNLLCPSYTLPSRQMLSSNLIPEMMATTRKKVLTNLEEASAVCLTADSWTSVNSDTFVGITAHYVDKQTKLCSSFLNCIKFAKEDTAQNLAHCLLRDTVQGWCLGNKVVGVVSDNEVNITDAVRICGWQHIMCFAHSLNLVVETALREIEVTTRKVRNIVEFFKCNSSALAQLTSAQKEMNLLDLKICGGVGWRDTYDMFSLFCFNKEAVIETLEAHNKGINTITPAEWTLLKISKEVLEVFIEISTEMSNKMSVALSKISLMVSALNRHLNQYQQDESLNEECWKLVATLKYQISVQFKDIEDNELVAQTILLDPRFKQYGFTNDVKFQTASNVMRHRLVALATQEPKVPKANSLWEEFDLEASEKFPADTIEMEKYLQEPLLGRLEDPLAWWREKKHAYPRLYQMVLERLCLVATAVPSPLLFSERGQILRDKRSKLNEPELSYTLFLSCNYE